MPGARVAHTVHTRSRPLPFHGTAVHFRLSEATFNQQMKLDSFPLSLKEANAEVHRLEERSRQAKSDAMKWKSRNIMISSLVAQEKSRKMEAMAFSRRVTEELGDRPPGEAEDGGDANKLWTRVMTEKIQAQNDVKSDVFREKWTQLLEAWGAEDGRGAEEGEEDSEIAWTTPTVSSAVREGRRRRRSREKKGSRVKVQGRLSVSESAPNLSTSVQNGNNNEGGSEGSNGGTDSAKSNGSRVLDFKGSGAQEFEAKKSVVAAVTASEVRRIPNPEVPEEIEGGGGSKGRGNILPMLASLSKRSILDEDAEYINELRLERIKEEKIRLRQVGQR